MSKRSVQEVVGSFVAGRFADSTVFAVAAAVALLRVQVKILKFVGWFLLHKYYTIASYFQMQVENFEFDSLKLKLDAIQPHRIRRKAEDLKLAALRLDAL